MRVVVILSLYVAIACTPTKNSEPAETKAQEEQVIQSEASIQTTWDSVRIEILDVTGFYPQFANEGLSIVFTKQTYDGLWIYDLRSQSTRQLTKQKGAGYKPVIIKGKVIYQVRARLKYLEEVELSTGTISQVDEGQSRLTPEEYVILREEILEEKKISVHLSTDLFSIEIKQNNGNVNSIAPLGKKNYLNPSLSPNQQMLLFEVAGLGGYITDLSGNLLEELGDLDDPVWLGNNEIVYTVSNDDGEQMVSSEVFVYSLENKNKYHLSNEIDDQVGNPKVNFAGNKVVVNSPDGKIFILKRK